jgi:DNA polymerase-3 subunit epsilon
MYLIYDTETTGFYLPNRPLSDADQPRIVQIAAALLDDDLKLCGSINFIIKPDGYEIPAKTTEIHGISTEKANQCGIPLDGAMKAFCELADIATHRIAHNQDFDFGVVGCALTVLNWRDNLNHLTAMAHICTMKASHDLCALPPTEKMMAAGRYGFKQPKLEEAYQHFYGQPMPYQAHDAMGDVMATADVLRKLIEGGHV